MPYELLSQGRKLNKREMGEGVLTRAEGKGGWLEDFLKKNKRGRTLIRDLRVLTV